MFIDADAVVIKNIDELFKYDEMAAAPECCDRFNTGVFVAKPSKRTMNDMLSKINTLPSYDNADQARDTLLHVNISTNQQKCCESKAIFLENCFGFTTFLLIH